MSGSKGSQADVVIGYDPVDISIVEYVTDGIKKKGISVWHHGLNEMDTTDQALLQCKVFLLVLSTDSVKNTKLADQMALAYVSNKSVIPVARQFFRKIAGDLDGGMKLMLAKINWIFFAKEEQFETNLAELIDVITGYLEKAKDPASSDDQSAATSEGGSSVNIDRLVNTLTTKVDRRPSNADTSETKTADVTDNARPFWERHWGTQSIVTWVDFREKFLADYSDRFTESLDENQQRMFIHFLYRDVFELNKSITYSSYNSFAAEKKYSTAHEFFNRLRDYVTGYVAMRSVFDMDSSVRLTAIRNLGKFHTPAVVMMLFDLVKDDDPNIRAVAALALAKTGKTMASIEDQLIKLLEDEDRLVRESACLSLGHMKCLKASPHIVDRWRNDPIKHVREAAEMALSRMGGEEADQAIKMTHVLSREMENLRTSAKVN